eukprot:scaffold317877_cov43-Attheya_sp.AAC.1
MMTASMRRHHHQYYMCANVELAVFTLPGQLYEEDKKEGGMLLPFKKGPHQARIGGVCGMLVSFCNWDRREAVGVQLMKQLEMSL